MSWLLVIFCLCIISAHFRMSSIIHGLIAMASLIIFHISVNITSFFLSRDVMTILWTTSCSALFLTSLMFSKRWCSLVNLSFCLILPMIFSKKIISESIIICHASKNCAINNICVALVLIILRARQKNRVKKAASSKTKNLTDVNGESSLFFI